MVLGRVDYEVFNPNLYDRKKSHSFTDHFAILEQLEIDLVFANRYVVWQRNLVRNAAWLRNVTPPERSSNSLC